MGAGLTKGITGTQFYFYGKKHFTKTGWQNASKNYVPNELESINMENKTILITGANSGIGYAISEFYAKKGFIFYIYLQ